MTTLTKLKIKMWLKKLEMKRNERKHLMSLVKVMDAADTLYAFESATWKIICDLQLHKRVEDTKAFTFKYPNIGKEITCIAVVKPLQDDKPEESEEDEDRKVD